MSTATLEHPLSTIADGAYAQFTQAPEQQLAQGQAARTLLDQFGQPEATQKRVESLYYMAVDGLTCEEFDSAMSDALSMAKKADSMAGWKAPEGAKGRDLYGPRQSSLASNASNARQVFGCCKVSPTAIVKAGPSGVVQSDLFPNFSKAYALAVAELGRLKLNWKGQALDVMQAAKKAKQENNAAIDIDTACRLKNPQQAGETIEQWDARIEALMPDFEQAATDATMADAGAKLYKSLLKKYDNDAGMVESLLIAALKSAGFEVV